MVISGYVYLLYTFYQSWDRLFKYYKEVSKMYYDDS
nr:MAG TPA: hypothetical protein [Caudoviricetes sp.]